MKLILVMLSLFLGGCTTYWSKQGATSEEANRDIYQCKMEVASAYPVSMVQTTTGNGYQAPATTNCQRFGNQINCTTTPGFYTPPATYSRDINSTPRQQAFSHCMMAKGYTSGRASKKRKTQKYNLQCYVQCKEDVQLPDSCRNKCREN